MPLFEQSVRTFVHQALLKKDKHYQRLEHIHMNEQTGVISVKWVDCEGRIRDDKMQFTRKM